MEELQSGLESLQKFQKKQQTDAKRPQRNTKLLWSGAKRWQREQKDNKQI